MEEKYMKGKDKRDKIPPKKVKEYLDKSAPKLLKGKQFI